MKTSVKDEFDKVANDYDKNRRKVIPFFDEFYLTGIDFLDPDIESLNVLDIGAGTGLFSEKLISRYPDAKLTLIDFSEEMLELAKCRFSERLNVLYILDDYLSFKFEQSYDVIISALSIHHLNEGEKKDFYKKVFSLLNVGGEFINADQVISQYPSVQEKYEKKWIDFVKNNGFSEEQIVGHRTRMSLDDPSTISDQIKWMSEAGFEIAECLFKANNFAVLYGKK